MRKGLLCLFAAALLLTVTDGKRATAKKQESFNKKAPNFMHELGGRPILTHSQGTVPLRPVSTVKQLRFNHEEEYLPYLIRVTRPADRALVQSLIDAAGPSNVRYVPHDAYVASLKWSDMVEISREHGVEGAFYVPDAMKLEPLLLPVLDENFQIGRNHSEQGAIDEMKEALNQSDTALHVMLTKHAEAGERAGMLETIEREIANKDFAGQATFLWVSSTKLLVQTPSDKAESVVRWLSTQLWVLFVAVKPTYTAFNRAET
eukprot:3195990-Rhodomonas_salina.1